MILVSKKEPYGTIKSIKYFIEYNDDDVIRLLCIKLPQMIGCVKCFNNNDNNNNNNNNNNNDNNNNNSNNNNSNINNGKKIVT